MRNHVVPLLGHLEVGQLDAETLDSFYAELRRCRIHCSGRGLIDHRMSRRHVCAHRCVPHQCKPLTTTVRHIHFILSGAFKRAGRWRRVATNPFAQAVPPAAAKPNPRPPSAEQAARILNKAWDDQDWATVLWGEHRPFSHSRCRVECTTSNEERSSSASETRLYTIVVECADGLHAAHSGSGDVSIGVSKRVDCVALRYECIHPCSGNAPWCRAPLARHSPPPGLRAGEVARSAPYGLLVRWM